MEKSAEKSFNAVFVSNYINHHQIPFCNAMSRLLEKGFTFIQTEPMEAERVQMGWHEAERPDYVRCFYEEEEVCRRLILESDIVMFGGTDEEDYIRERLESGKPVVRVSERLYKTGQWKAVSPRGLRKKYIDHTRYRRASVYLLCAGAYVASDFHLVGAYPGKMFCWGYFPETRHYDLDRLMEKKGHSCMEAGGAGGSGIPCILWAGRMIGWKHPELAVETAGYLRDRGCSFHMDIIGDGELRLSAEKLAESCGLGSFVKFHGYQPPETVRHFMEKADIFLFTSDRQEGWGAVANEAMNSGCALVAGHRIGAVPFLMENGVNGLIYKDGRKNQLFGCAEKLVRDRELCRRLGRKAYERITGAWNAENAAKRLTGLMRGILAGNLRERPEGEAGQEAGLLPCSAAPVLWERQAGKAPKGFYASEPRRSDVEQKC